VQLRDAVAACYRSNGRPELDVQAGVVVGDIASTPEDDPSSRRFRVRLPQVVAFHFGTTFIAEVSTDGTNRFAVWRGHALVLTITGEFRRVAEKQVAVVSDGRVDVRTFAPDATQRLALRVVTGEKDVCDQGESNAAAGSHTGATTVHRTVAGHDDPIAAQPATGQTERPEQEAPAPTQSADPIASGSARPGEQKVAVSTRVHSPSSTPARPVTPAAGSTASATPGSACVAPPRDAEPFRHLAHAGCLQKSGEWLASATYAESIPGLPNHSPEADARALRHALLLLIELVDKGGQDADVLRARALTVRDRLIRDYPDSAQARQALHYDLETEQSGQPTDR
jgi:hypothetical protein